MANHVQALVTARSVVAEHFVNVPMEGVVHLAEAYLELLQLVTQLRKFSFAIEQLPFPPRRPSEP